VLFVCENNLYGEYTPWEQVTAGADIAARAGVFGIETTLVDGMDVGEVYRHAITAVEAIRDGAGPRFLECRTYRFVGHSRSDPATYRKPGELEEWKKRDPLLVAQAALRAQGIPASVIGEADSVARARVAEAFQVALASPYPTVEAAL
jgi:TPP-dependent pyruvate/acetoin dehydrogenase alpha subunit